MNRRARFTRRSVALAALGALAALQGLLAPQAALAQTAAQQVDIIGTTPLPGLDLPKDRVPAHVQTATGSEIERSHAIDLSSFLNRRLGSVHLNEVQNNPFQPDLNFRGFTASPLLGTAQGLSVYLDGVRLNQPFGDVVSWDLIPKSAIASLALMPGSNPLFGLNTLGGALAVRTKDGLKHPGSSVQWLAGQQGRLAAEFETGGGRADGLNWFVTGNAFHEKGWRLDSPSDVGQLFGKFGYDSGDTRWSLATALADTDLNGNGLQEGRLLAQHRASVYSKPDTTHNRSALLNLAASHTLANGLSLSGNVYWRRIKTRTTNGDVNDDALDQSVYQPDADEQAALTAAGYTGFPTSGANASHTPFPTWRCIANVLLVSEPGEKCNGLINRSDTSQTNFGLAAQINGEGRLAGLPHQWVAGVALDVSRVQFRQGTELGTINSDHGITGAGAFGDGVTGGQVDGEPYDTRVDLSARTRTASLFANAVLALSPRSHLTLSGRYNRTTVQNRDAISPGGGAGSLDGDHRFSRFNPAIGLTWAASKGLTAYGGFNQGSRAPSAVELGCADPANPCKLPNAMAGDPPLKQVVTSTLEAGVRGSFAAGTGTGNVAWNLGVFRADNQHDILFVADNAAGYGYFKNFGKTRRQGVEAGFSTPLAGLNIGANYTWLDATFRSAETVGGAGNSSNEAAAAGLPGVGGNIAIQPGHRLPLVPRHQLKAFAELALAGPFTIGADVTAMGSSLARGNENNAHQADGTYTLGSGRSAGYAVLNLNADWRPTPAVTVFVQVNNVLDRPYSTAAQLGATAFDANGHFVARPLPAHANGDWPLVSSTFYAPGAPRNIYLGMRYTFGRR